MNLIDAHRSSNQLRRVLAHLEEREAENGIAWTTVASALRPTDPLLNEAGAVVPLIRAVEKAGVILASAVWTPPFPLLVTRANPKVLHLLAESFAAMANRPAKVLGAADASAAFAEAWRQIMGFSSQFARGMIIYQATTVMRPEVDGTPDHARINDLETLFDWSRRSAKEVGLGDAGLSRETIRLNIEDKTIRVWRDQQGQPVSTASEAGRTRNGGRVSGVYTPPEMRGRGYASACTAMVTRDILESGCRFAYLYADAANPQANRIYQRIGYRRECDMHLYQISSL